MSDTIKIITQRKVVSGIPTIKLHDGSDLVKDFIWLEHDGTPKDLSGWGAEFGVKLRKNLSDYVIYTASYDAISYITIEPGGEKGLIRLNVPFFEFYNLNIVWGVWELIIFPDPLSPSEGRIKLLDGAMVYIKRVIDVVIDVTVLWADDDTVLWDDNSQPLVF